MATYEDLKVLANDCAITGSAVAVYTAPVGKTVQVSMLWLHNKSEDPAAVIVKMNGTADKNIIFNEELAANTTYEVSPKVPFVLAAEETVNISSTEYDAINYYIVGRESD